MSSRAMATARTAPSANAASPRALVIAIRPAEWIKNLFVLAPLIFSGRFDDIGAWGSAILAFLAFCAVSSAGYLINDVRDAEFDRAHPSKRDRPIACGDLSPRIAIAAAAVLGAAGVATALVVNVETTSVVLGYVALTTTYSLILKTVVIVDVMAIAGCFLLRVVAGALAIDAHSSRWLIVCTVMLALFIGFTKRRQEAMTELHEGVSSRPVLKHYSLAFLDQMIPIVTAGTVISYAIYATESPLVGDRMLATAPVVLYGILRYLYLIYHRGDERGTAEIITHDSGLLTAMGLWALTAVLVVYL